MNLVELAAALGRKEYVAQGSFLKTPEKGKPPRVFAWSVAESGIDIVIQDIIGRKKRPTWGKNIAVTYGGFLGVDLAIAGKVSGVLLADINPQQLPFWNSVLEVIAKEDELGKFQQRFSAVKERFSLEQPEKNNDPTFQNAEYVSFVEDEGKYQQVRKLVLAGMIAPLDMDVLDTERHRQLRGMLDKNDYNVGLIYLSNIPYFYDTDYHSIDFYGREIDNAAYELIFSNQRIIGSDDTRVIKYDAGDKGSPMAGFLESQTLFQILQRIHR